MSLRKGFRHVTRPAVRFDSFIQAFPHVDSKARAGLCLKPPSRTCLSAVATRAGTRIVPRKQHDERNQLHAP